MIAPLSYIGGKSRLAQRIVALFPTHRTYVEPFAGAAHVFFRKEASAVEVLNDLDGEIVNFYRVCQQHYEELLRCFKFVVISREWFRVWKRSDPETLTDIQRAARYLYLLRNAYASAVRSPSFERSTLKPPKLNLVALPDIIEHAHRRLQRVQIECAPYERIVERFDHPASLHYLDPPYFGTSLYRHNFSPVDFERLAKLLATVRGKFVLSLNDVPEVRTLFRTFQVRSVALYYRAQLHTGPRQELLITNFTPNQP